MEQRGTASGLLGLATMVGSLAGGVGIFSFEQTGLIFTYFLLIVVHGKSMAITVWMIEEESIAHKITILAPTTLFTRCTSLTTPFFNHDFRVVFFTRFLFQLGIVSAQEFLNFYLADFHVGSALFASSPQQAVSILFVPLLLGAMLSSFISGVLSDQMGGKRKQLMCSSEVMMCLSCFLFAFTRSYTADLLFGLVFGIGYGIFSTIDWALAQDCLPNQAEYAKDMGIYMVNIAGFTSVVSDPNLGLFIRCSSTDISSSYIWIYSHLFIKFRLFFLRHVFHFIPFE